jgi:hypothetical protein
MDDPGFELRHRQNNIHIRSGVQAASCLVGTEFVPGVKRPPCDVHHSPPSSTEVKRKWSFTSAPPACLLSVDSEDFTLCMFVCALCVCVYVCVRSRLCVCVRVCACVCVYV